jgi:hypothetical protein
MSELYQLFNQYLQMDAPSKAVHKIYIKRGTTQMDVDLLNIITLIESGEYAKVNILLRTAEKKYISQKKCIVDPKITLAYLFKEYQQMDAASKAVHKIYLKRGITEIDVDLLNAINKIENN